MSKPFRVMLATDYNPDKLKLPCYASPKLDGIRAYVRDGIVLSRQNKPIPNKFVQAQFKAYEHFDGELIVGDPTDPMCYRNTMSGVMSEDGEPDVTFWVFDRLEVLHERYYHRMPTAKKFNLKGRVKALEQKMIHTITQLQAFEAECLELGYEGVIIRDPDAPYKQGRSTVNEGYLLKVKAFQDFECEVVGFEERMHNCNEATVSETGHTKRSSHKANKVGRGDLGALILKDPSGAKFNCGTGFTDAERENLWTIRDTLVGKIVKVKAFPIGGYNTLRHPVYIGFRSEIDL